MLRKLLPIGTLLLFAAATIIGSQAQANAAPRRDDARRYDRRVPPGHQVGHHKWIPPGHRKHADRNRHHDCDICWPRWDNRRDRGRYDCDRRYRPQDARNWRYMPDRRRDRDREDYGIIIRKGPRGTTVDVEYRKRDR